MTGRDEIGDYLLGELDTDARARFEARIGADPALRAEVERLAPVVRRLEAVEPGVWESQPVRAGVGAGADPGGTGAEPARSHGPRRLRLPSLPLRTWAAIALASVALLATGVAVGLLIDGGDGVDPDGSVSERVVVLMPLGPAPTTASATARMTGPGRIRLAVRNLPPASTGTYYEAWLLGGPGRVVPIASFSVDGDGGADLELPLPATAGSYHSLDVSLQRLGDGTEHSAVSVLRGRLN
jgi:Anti-sigma-K factor rskA